MDPIVISAIVASFVTLIGSFGVELWRHRKEQQREQNEKIERIYIHEGLEPIISDLSRYGTAIITTIDYVRRNLEAHSDDLPQFLDRLSRRETIRDLISFNYKLASKALPKLFIFGRNREIFNAVINGFYTWSLFAQDLVDYARAKMWLKHVEEREEWLKGSAIIVQDIMLYLVDRLFALLQLIKQKHYNKLEVFRRDMMNKISPLIQEMKEFFEVWKNWHESTGEDRRRASQAFHEWVSEKLKEAAPLEY